jgi:hypothetical protein
VSGVIETIDGGEAHFESQVTYTGDTTFIESGSISFGDGSNKLFFGTIGQAHVDVSADPDLRHGAVIWKIERGEGMFEGASGIITSNFVVRGNGREVREIIDNHFGVIFVK